MFLERISNFLVKNRKKIFFYSLFGFLFFFLSNDVTFADTTNDKTDLVEMLNSGLAGVSALAGIMMYIVTLFLDPEFTSGNIFGLTSRLHDIWILVSNVVYFIFAFILIWIAFMNIIGKGDKWELKQAMPKFIIGVLIVPFSWFFVTIIVSLANILTIAALTLPSDTFTDYKDKLDKIKVPTDCAIDFSSLGLSGKNSDSKATKSGSQATNKKPAYLKQGEWFGCSDKEGDRVGLGESMNGTTLGLISSYVYGIVKIDKLDELRKNQLSSSSKLIGNVLDVIIFIIFNALFIIIFLILLITLGIVLLVRAVWLWIYMALAPLFGLAYFFGKDGGGDLMKKFSITEFIGLAMVPVYTVLALSFGFLFMYTATSGLSSTDNVGTGGNNNQVNKLDKGKKYTINDNVIKINTDMKGTNNKNIEFKLHSYGAPFSQLTKSAKDNSGYTNGLGSTIGGFFGAVFLNIFGVVVFRIAIMAALQSSSITKEIVAPIKQFGDSVGSLVAKAPSYAPVFGVGKHAQSMQSMSSIAQQVSSTISGRQTERASKFINDKLPGFSSSSSDRAKIYSELKGYINNDGKIATNDIAYKKVAELLKTTRHEELLKHQETIAALKAMNGGKEVHDLKEADKVINKFAKTNESKKWIPNFYNTFFQKADKYIYDKWYSGTAQAPTTHNSSSHSSTEVSRDYTSGNGKGVINLGGQKISVKVDNNGHFSDVLLKADKDDFAKYVINNVHTKEELNDFIGRLNIKDADSVYNTIKDYLYKDKTGNLIFVGDSTTANKYGYTTVNIVEFKNKLK